MYASFIQWNENYSVGISKIDTQHKKLISIIQELFEAMKNGKASTVLASIFDQLTAYTKKHFSLEEEYFSKYQYPQANQHAQEHAKLIEEVVRLKESFAKAQIGISIETLNFLKDWLVKHILKSDMDYAPYLKSKGMK